MKTQQQSGPAPSGSSTPLACYMFIKLEPGKKLQFVTARNSTRGGSRITLAIAGPELIRSNVSQPIQANIGDDYLQLNPDTNQGGISDAVIWNGPEVQISSDRNVIVASFADVTDGDILRLAVGVEDEI